MDGIKAEKGKWVQVKGTFEADGGEHTSPSARLPAADFNTKRLIEGLDNNRRLLLISMASA